MSQCHLARSVSFAPFSHLINLVPMIFLLIAVNLSSPRGDAYSKLEYHDELWPRRPSGMGAEVNPPNPTCSGVLWSSEMSRYARTFPRDQAETGLAIGRSTALPRHHESRLSSSPRSEGRKNVRFFNLISVKIYRAIEIL